MHVNNNNFTGPLIIRTFEKQAPGEKWSVAVLRIPSNNLRNDNLLFLEKVANGLLTFLLSILGHLEKLQRRVFDLVSNAYTSIRADDLASLMGVSTEAAVSGKFIISLITVSYRRTNFMCSIQDLK